MTPLHPDAAAPAPTGEALAGPRVSTVECDRLCIRCGFNLVGQPVVREPVYGMLMVRCPECSTPASLQEYPILGPWAARWATALAALWLLVLVILLFMSAGFLLAEGMGIATDSGQKINAALEQAQREWFKGLDAKGRAALPQWVASSMQSSAPALGWLAKGWWDSVDRNALLAAAGGWRGATNWRALANWPWVILSAAIMGALWSVFLLAIRRKRLLLMVLALPSLAAALEYAFGDNGNTWMTGVTPTTDAAFSLVGWRVFLLTLAVTPIGLWAGVLCGRPLARALARILLPPRMVSSLAALWVADGMPPPRPRTR